MARPTKPTNLKLLQNTARKDRLNPNEPKPEVVIPDPPEHLSELALKEWKRITPELEKLGLLSNIDRFLLAAYCQAYGRWKEAEEGVKGGGFVIITQSGNIIQNPLLGVANVAMRDCYKFAVEFGMSPSSRSKVSGTEKPKPKSRWVKFQEKT